MAVFKVENELLVASHSVRSVFAFPRWFVVITVNSKGVIIWHKTVPGSQHLDESLSPGYCVLTGDLLAPLMTTCIDLGHIPPPHLGRPKSDLIAPPGCSIDTRYSELSLSERELPLPCGSGLVAQSCPALCDPMDCSPPGSSLHGIFQARVLEWGAIAYSKGSS